VAFHEVVPFVRGKGLLYIAMAVVFSVLFFPDLGFGVALGLALPWWLAPLWLLGAAFGITVWWWVAPPPFLEEYARANRVITIHAHGAKLDTGGGLFDLHRLSTLRLTPEGALEGRRLIVFAGSAVPTAQLVGWPGMPEAEAAAIIRVVLDRVSPGR